MQKLTGYFMQYLVVKNVPKKIAVWRFVEKFEARSWPTDIKLPYSKHNID